MTRKDYIKLAEIIKKNMRLENVRNNPMHVIGYGDFLHDLCDYLKTDNSKFNEIKFREATGEILGK